MKQTSEGEVIETVLGAKLGFSYLASQCHLADKYKRSGRRANSSKPLTVPPLPPSSVLVYRYAS